MIRKLTHEEMIGRQKEKIKQPRLGFHVILNNVRSAYNVGSIFRSADGAGVGKIWLCGITGYPPNREIAKTALGAELQVPWSYKEDAVSVIKELKKQGYQIVLLEQAQKSVAYLDFKPRAPVGLVIGNEIDGVCEKIIEYCDAAVEIEMAGLKNSLNVSVAFGIVAYHFRDKLCANHSHLVGGGG